MNRMLLAALLAALMASAGVSGQESQPAQDRQGAEEKAPRQEASAEEPLPDIDVWDETEENKDEVFVPSESISADSSIAFPSDI